MIIRSIIGHLRDLHDYGGLLRSPRMLELAAESRMMAVLLASLHSRAGANSMATMEVLIRG